MQSIGTYLKQRRESLSLKQKDVANSVGVSSAYLNKVEKGDSIPAPAFLEKIARTLELDFIDLYLRSLEDRPLPDTLMHAMREYRSLRPLLAPGMPVERFRSFIRSMSPEQTHRILLMIESVVLMIHEAEDRGAGARAIREPVPGDGTGADRIPPE